jgi:hypothetical protein
MGSPTPVQRELETAVTGVVGLPGWTAYIVASYSCEFEQPCRCVLCRTTSGFWRWHVHGNQVILEEWSAEQREWRPNVHSSHDTTDLETLVTLWVLSA